jgi:Flp pilus assembly protein TadG
MINALRRLIGCAVGSAAVETAIFLPLFLLFTVGITDLGSVMFAGMTVNAATQAGAAYAIVNSGCTPTPCTPVCASLTSACRSGIITAMNNAAANSSWCTTATCTPTISVCPDGSLKCIRVSASLPYSPLLPDSAYAWVQSLTTLSAKIIVRVS